MSKEVLDTYLKEIEIRYGMETRIKVETLHQKGHLGEDLILLLLGQSPAHPVILCNLGKQIESNQGKSKRM